MVDKPPPGAEGVPTQTSEMSVLNTAARASVVTVRSPAATTSAVRSPIFSSTTGDLPCRRDSTLSGLTSTPTTRRPRDARQAADTQPTYPSPKTLTACHLRIAHDVLTSLTAGEEGTFTYPK